MFIKYLGVLMMSYQLMSTVASQDCDLRLLDIHADTFNHRIWSETVISEESIQRALDFLRKEDMSKVQDFKKLYNEKKALIPFGGFIAFADACDEIYENGGDKTKIAIGMLLEAVSKKSLPQYILLERVRASREQEEKDRQSGKIRWTAEDDRSLAYFLNADKSIPLGMTHRPIVAGRIH